MDRRRAQKIQLKKREDISDAEEKRKQRPGHSPLPQSPLSSAISDAKKPSSLLSSSVTSTPGLGAMAKKRKKKGKVGLEPGRKISLKPGMSRASHGRGWLQ